MRRTQRTATALLALALAVTACGGDDDTADTPDDGAEAPDDGAEDAELSLVNEGTLTVCSEVPYEPFEFEDPDSEVGYSGFDIDLINAVAETAGLAPVEVINTGFEGLTSGATMAAGTCDLAASAMTITEEREENIDFSDPYYDALQSLLAPSDSDISGIGDLTSDVVVGVQSGTTGEAYAQENVEEAEIRSFEGGGDLFTALEAGQIDAILQDLPVNAEYVRTNEGVEIVEEYDTEESYGFAVEQERDDDLLQVINDGLQQLRDESTYDEIYDRYFGTE